MLSIYYEYCKSDITDILFMLDFTCKLMKNMKPESTGERQTDTLGKGISKLMNSNIGFAEGGFCWLFVLLVVWVFSENTQQKYQEDKILRRNARRDLGN